jgi:hypothetical protein
MKTGALRKQGPGGEVKCEDRLVVQDAAPTRPKRQCKSGSSHHLVGPSLRKQRRARVFNLGIAPLGIRP